MNKHFNQIEDYIDGVLPESEKIAFERAMAEDPSLQEAVLFQQELHAALKNRLRFQKEEEQLRASLNAQRHFFNTPSKGQIKPYVFRWPQAVMALGAAACLLIALNFLGVFSAGLSELPLLKNETTRGKSPQPTLSEGIQAFNDHRYKVSISLFQGILQQDTAQVRVRYYLGLSYLGNKAFESAIETLKPLAGGPSVYKNEAAYFAAVAAWKQEDIPASIQYAEQVSKESPYYTKAQKLLKKIRPVP